MNKKNKEALKKYKTILASSSQSRRGILKEAGLNILSKAPNVDEDALKKTFKGSPKGLAIMLAEEKALSVSREHKDTLVIGADQVLSFAGKAYGKPKSLNQAKESLRKFKGKTHKLESATAIALNGKIIWRHQDSPALKMRDFSDKFLNLYIKKAGKKTLLSAGGYSIEKEGAQLFSKIEGDFFTIIGLPLIPLLKKLRILNSAEVCE